MFRGRIPNLANAVVPAPLPVLPAPPPRVFTPLEEGDQPRRHEWTILHATVALAFMIHMLGLYSYVVMNPDLREDGYKFFTDVQLATKSEISVTQMEPPKPKEEPPPPPPKPKVAVPPPPPKTLAVAPPRPVTPPPGGSRPAPRVAALPKATQRTYSAPNVVTARHGSDVAVATGTGGGAATGSTTGPGGTGKGGDGTGTGTGNGNGPGSGVGPAAPPPPPPQPYEKTSSGPVWDNWRNLGIGSPPGDVPTRAAECKTWEEIIPVLGLDKAKLYSQELVLPYCRGQINPDLRELDAIGGVNATVTIHVVLSDTGIPTPTIAKGTGNTKIDTVAYAIARGTMWLPALRYGKPVQYEFEYDLGFSSSRAQ